MTIRTSDTPQRLAAVDAAPLLRVEQLSKTFSSGGGLLRRRSAPVQAVDDVSFVLRRGETLGLVGETGSGKSTVGRLILRLLRPSSGQICFDGQDISHWSGSRVRRLRRDVQMVFQDPYGSLDPRMQVQAIIAEPMRVHGLWSDNGPARVAEIMRRMSLPETAGKRYPHQFSGGQRQRIGIARAMGVQPKLLVLDEPVSALDVSIQAQIINLLRDLQQQAELAFLFIAHDLAVVRHVSDTVAVMYLGRIVEMGPRDAIYENPWHPYTRALLSAVPVPQPQLQRGKHRVLLHGEIGSATALPSGCRFHPRCYKARLLGAGKAFDVATVTPDSGEKLPQICVLHDPKLIVPAAAGGVGDGDGDGDEHTVACHFPELD